MDSITESVVEWFSEAIATVFKWFAGWWLQIGSFELSGPVGEARPIVMWLAGLVVMIGLARAAVGLALRQRGDPMGQALGGLMVFAVVAAASLPVAQTLLDLSDALAQWIVEALVGDDMGDRVVGVAAVASRMAPGLVIVVGIVVILGGLMLAAGMILREAALIFLVALLPLAAAGYVMRGSSRWLPTLAGWCGALMLWKPLAALAYGLSAALVRGGDSDWRMLMAGLAMLFLSIFALPMLVKLLGGWAGQTVGTGGPFSPKAAGRRMASVGGAAVGGVALAEAGTAMAASRISASAARAGGGAASAAGGSGSPSGAAAGGGGASPAPSPPATSNPGSGGPGGSPGATSSGATSSGATSNSHTSGGAPAGGGGSSSAGGGGPAAAGSSGPSASGRAKQVAGQQAARRASNNRDEEQEQ
jgi:hypothetical protein